MDSSNIVLFFFYAILIVLVKPTIAQRDPYVAHRCSTGGDVAPNSTYRANAVSLLSSLSSRNGIHYGFYSFSAGENLDKVNAIAFCRADQSPNNCRRCVNMSAYELLDTCATQKEGIMWYMNCTVRYSNRTIFRTMEFEPVQILYAGNATDADVNGTFNLVLMNLLEGLRSKAASGGSLRKFATGRSNVSYLDLFALLQCTPDLDEQQCRDCLSRALRNIPNCCAFPPVALRVLQPSCNVRYQEWRFYDIVADSPPPRPAEGMVPLSCVYLHSQANWSI